MSDIAAKVAALLSKAESTTFPDEADALTAKAHALMAKYRIDAAMVAAVSGVLEEGGIVQHVFIMKGSYGARKLGLAHAVARATGCKGVSTDFGKDPGGRRGWRYRMTVFGTKSDTIWCEDLFYSLCRQMDSSIARETKLRGYAGGTGRQFGTGFVAGFTNEVAKRLKAVNETAVREAQDAAKPGEPSVAVVLASKAERVEKEFRIAFPRTGTRYQASVTSYTGYGAGKTAGATATIARGSVGGSSGARAGIGSGR